MFVLLFHRRLGHPHRCFVKTKTGIVFSQKLHLSQTLAKWFLVAQQNQTTITTLSQDKIGNGTYRGLHKHTLSTFILETGLGVSMMEVAISDKLIAPKCPTGNVSA